jgi:hypothetical protein
MRRLVFALLVAGLAGCGSNQDDTGRSTASAPAIEASAPANEASIPEDSTPKQTHFYDVEDNGEYGYEAALTEEDRNKGVGAGQITMVRLLEHSGDFWRFYLHQGSIGNVTTCKEPCEFAKAFPVVNGYGTGEPQMSRVAVGTILWSVIQDSKNGQLEVYGKPKVQSPPPPVTPPATEAAPPQPTAEPGQSQPGASAAS